MADEYDEVVNLVMKTDAANAELKRIFKIAEDKKLEFEAGGVEVKIKATEFVADLNKLVQEKIKADQKIADAAIREAERAAKAKAAIAAKEAREAARVKKEEENAAVKEEREVAKALYAYRKAMDRDIAREELLIAKELFRYREEGEKALQNQKIAYMRQQAQLQKQMSQFDNIFAPGGKPLPIDNKKSSINVSAALRTGAGASAALGSYPAAGALYASANAMQTLGVATVSTATAMTTLGVAIPFVAGGVLLFAGKEFNEELAKMSTLLGSATDSTDVFRAKLDAVAASAIKISAEFNLGTTEVIKAFKEALSSGIEGEDLERFTRGAAQLATGLGVSLTESANILTGFKDSYQLTISELSKANDVLFNTVNYGKVNVDQLVTNFGRLLPIGKAAGLSIEDLATGVAVLTRRGLTASQAVTAMTQVVNGLVSPSDKAKKALDAMGISTGDAAFASKNLTQVIEQIRSATGGSGELLGTIFNEERAKRGISALTDSVDLFKQVRVGIDETGTAAIASDRALNTLWSNIGKSISSLTGPVKKFGSDLSDALNHAIYGSDKEQAAEAKRLADNLKMYEDFYAEKLRQGITNRDELAKLADAKFGEHERRFNPTYGVPGVPSEYSVTTNAAALAQSLDTAFAKVKEGSTKTINEVTENIGILDREVHKFIDDMAKIASPSEKQSKIDLKQFGERASDDQKQKLDDLKTEIEDKKELLDVEIKMHQIDMEKAISERRNTYLTPARDKLEAAQRGGKTDAIIGAQAEMLEAEVKVQDFIDQLKNSLEVADPFAPLLNQINRLNKQIDTLYENVSTQDTRKERAKADAEAKKQQEQNLKDLREYDNIVERLYKQDTSNYEKAQKERAEIFRRINKEIEKEAKKSAQLQADISNNILKSKIDQHSDDPGGQVRIGRGGREAAYKELQDLAGKGENRDAFDAAVKKYQEASELVKNAMKQIDANRAERNYQNDENALLKLDQQFNAGFQDNERRKAMAQSERDNSVRVRTPAELAKDASGILQTEKKIEQVELQAKIKMEVTGELSEKTKKEIVELVVNKVNQARKNNNPPPSPYDPSTRSGSGITVRDDD